MWTWNWSGNTVGLFLNSAGVSVHRCLFIGTDIPRSTHHMYWRPCHIIAESERSAIHHIQWDKIKATFFFIFFFCEVWICLALRPHLREQINQCSTLLVKDVFIHDCWKIMPQRITANPFKLQTTCFPSWTDIKKIKSPIHTNWRLLLPIRRSLMMAFALLWGTSTS